MSRYRILRIDHYDPESIGKKNRLLFTIYGVLPTLFILIINLTRETGLNSEIGIIVLAIVLAGTYYFLIRKLRSTINKIKTIGELEITRSLLRKRLGDSVTEYSFEQIKDIRLIKHIPATRIKESKSRYFSYIMKINFHNLTEESMVISDMSVDHNQKMSLADTMKTLKKIVPFELTMEI